MSAETARRRLLSLRHAGDVVVGDFVRRITGGRLMLVESVTDEHALALLLHKGWGWKEVIPCSQLVRAVRP